jgi:voltage-gated potassium channel
MSGGGVIERFQHRCYEVLDVGSMHDPVSLLVHRVLIGIVLLSVSATVLESVPSLVEAYGGVFRAIELGVLVIFATEYILRLWAIVVHPPLNHLPAWRARLYFACTPALLIDLAAILPLLLTFFAATNDLQVLLLLRLLRFFKLARYSPGMRSLMEAIHGERRALLACLFILGGVMVMAAALMHAVEGKVQPEKYGTIPIAMYWAIITLTTVGYGDAFPVTGLGQVVAGATAVVGLVMLSLPVGIIATSFAEVIHRRDFVVTWNMVARVPIFSKLDATEIATIMRVLQSEIADDGEVIVHKDDPADAMYFIASGAVEVELEDRRVRLDEGHFFGEIAILQSGTRTATVRALEDSRLLVLNRENFDMLMEENADIAAHIRAVAEQRAGELPPGDPAARPDRMA